MDCLLQAKEKQCSSYKRNVNPIQQGWGGTLCQEVQG